MNLKRCKPCGCTHTRVFLQKLLERRKLVYNFLLKWSKGGSRELLEVSTLPRDLVC